MKKRLLAALMAMTLVIPSGNVFAAELGIQGMNVVEMETEEVEDTEEQQEELTGLLEEQGVRQAAEVERMTIEMTEGSVPEALQSGHMGRIDSCLIESADSGKVSVQFSVSEGVTLQGSLYLFAVSPYADSLEGYTPAAVTDFRPDMKTYVFETDLFNETEENRLYSKFVVATGNEEQYVPVSDYAYITNPEVLAADEFVAYTSAGSTGHNSKKGIQAYNNLLTDMEDLGISHTLMNFRFQEVISLTPTNYSYDYNGKTYYFAENIISDYDHMLSALTSAGITVSMAMLNVYKPGYEFLIYPGVSPNGAHGYAWNTVTAEGAGYIQATLSYLAKRYNGSNKECGKVTNWIIGNEVNDNKQYYYMGARDRNSFVTEYYKSFRMAYNTIRSGSADANVYIPLEPRWMTEDTMDDYAGRGFLETFNNLAKAEGNFDWGVAFHAYSHPLSTDSILKDGTEMVDQAGRLLEAGSVTDSWDSPVVTMRNIHVLTDFMQDGSMRNTSGAVRSVILSEQGWTSISNSGATETTQAANIAYAYYKAEMNPYIDAFIIRAMVDEDEGSPYFKFGLWNAETGGFASTKKYAYNIFKYMDTKESLAVTRFAKNVLGFADWQDEIPGFDASKFDSMRTIKTEGMTNLEDWGQAVNSKMLAADMINNWNCQYFIFTVGNHDYEGKYYPRGTGVVNQHVYYQCYQGLEKKFDTPLDLTNTPYLGFKINLKPAAETSNNDKILVRVRVFSGNHINDNNAIIDVNKDYNLCVNLGEWEYKDSVDRMEVWLKEYDKKESFDGTFTLYDLQCAEGIGNNTAMQGDPDLNPEAVLFAFSDVPVIKGNWKYESVKYVYENGIMNGITGTTLFKPDESLTRDMFATVLYRMEGSPAVEYTDKFTDVPDNKWYSKAIIWANQQGIVEGFKDGSYGVGANITREQIAKMLYLYAEFKGYDISQKASLNSFTDSGQVSGWATGYMEWATAVGMISGKPNGTGTYRLDPKGFATRAECAAMLMRFQKNYN